MDGFVRVRSAEGPEDEYDAPLSLVEAEPDRYIRINSATAVDEPADVQTDAD